jgi:hypothetical protein
MFFVSHMPKVVITVLALSLFLFAQEKNKITNPGFDNGLDGWNAFVQPGNPSYVTYIDGAALIDVNVVSEKWHVQFFQSGFAITAGKRYYISFKARVTAQSSTVPITVERNGNGYNKYLEQSFSAGQAWQTYTTSFVATESYADVKFGFYPGDISGELLVDDVYFSDKNPETNNFIANSDFSDGLNSWNTFVQTGNPSYVAYLKDIGAPIIDVNATGENWHVQLFQAGFSITAGKTYYVSFKARVTAQSSTVPITVERNGNGFNKYLEQSFPAGQTWQTYTTSFVATEDYEDVKVGFYPGAILGELEIDDVYFSDKSPDGEMLINGSADNSYMQ